MFGNEESGAAHDLDLNEPEPLIQSSSKPLHAVGHIRKHAFAIVQAHQSAQPQSARPRSTGALLRRPRLLAVGGTWKAAADIFNNDGPAP